MTINFPGIAGIDEVRDKELLLENQTFLYVLSLSLWKPASDLEVACLMSRKCELVASWRAAGWRDL